MIDLYLGGDLGVWVLDNILSNNIYQVFTNEKNIIEKSKSLDIPVSSQDPNVIEFTSSLNAFSIHYPNILKPHVISKYNKIYNLHPSFLPWGRGYYPIFWALWENTPAGATLHEINEGIDQGNIVHQIRVDYNDSDTGYSLFLRVREAEKKIFLEYWEKIINGKELSSIPQKDNGSYHSKKEFMKLKTNSNWEVMSAKDLIKLIRCFSFNGYSGLEILLEQKKFEISIKILES